MTQVAIIQTEEEKTFCINHIVFDEGMHGKNVISMGDRDKKDFFNILIVNNLWNGTLLNQTNPWTFMSTIPPVETKLFGV